MICRLLLEALYLRLRVRTEIVELKENEERNRNFRLKGSFIASKVREKTLRLRTDCHNRRK